MADRVVQVAPDDWLSAVTAAYEGTTTHFDWLGAVDELGREDVFRVATWHERETADMFGIRFTGGDARPILVPLAGQPGDLREFPLRKDVVLGARVAVPWPGAADQADTTRRRLPPPGVPDPDRFGTRAPDAPDLDPASLVEPPSRRRR
jgi:NADH-quinone oxidoreductase subunit C